MLLKRLQRRPDLIGGCLGQTGLALDPGCPKTATSTHLRFPSTGLRPKSAVVYNACMNMVRDTNFEVSSITYSHRDSTGATPVSGVRGGTAAGSEPQDLAENAVIARLADNWPRRAAVKRTEPDLDDLFEPDRLDYPDSLLPFWDHPTYRDLEPTSKSRLRAWAWIAFNKSVMDIEQYVVNPGFQHVTAGAFETGLDEAMTIAVTQAMVDEQYHTLMHLNASAVTRRRRGWRMPESRLPLAHKARRYQQNVAEAEDREQQVLIALAFTTVAEVSINAYLNLIADNQEIQPINRATASLHNRDEHCHASITVEIAKAAYARMSTPRREFFLRAVTEGLEAFAANDYASWHNIVEQVGVPGGGQMVRDVAEDPSRRRLVQDFSALYRLCGEIDAVDRLPFDWSSVHTG